MAGRGKPKRELPALAYDIAEAAEVARRGETKIKHAIATGALPARKDGKSTIILHDDLVAWLRSLPYRVPTLPALVPPLESGTAESNAKRKTPVPQAVVAKAVEDVGLRTAAKRQSRGASAGDQAVTT